MQLLKIYHRAQVVELIGIRQLDIKVLFDNDFNIFSDNNYKEHAQIDDL